MLQGVAGAISRRLIGDFPGGCASGFAALGVAAVILCAAPTTASAAGECKFTPQPPPVLKDMGPCNYDPGSQSYAGDPIRQAACLLTPVRKIGKLGPARDGLPAELAYRVGRNAGLPDRNAVRALVQERGLESVFGATLDRPVAMAHDGDPLARSATYFVIHDTSAPNYRGKSFPKDIDEDGGINRLANYSCSNNIERAHVFINRKGAILLAHDFETPWRATKFEMWPEFGPALKGLYLHTELIQPRRRLSGRGRGNDFEAPDPGFTPAQYDSLALVYVIASLRAGFWMIPGFHAVIDEGIWDKHDDPQNFELEAFARSVGRLMARLPRPDEPVVSLIRKDPTRLPASPAQVSAQTVAEPQAQPIATEDGSGTIAAPASPDGGPPPEP